MVDTLVTVWVGDKALMPQQRKQVILTTWQNSGPDHSQDFQMYPQGGLEADSRTWVLDPESRD